VRLLRGFGGHHLRLAALDVSAAVTQTLPDAVVRPAALTHIGMKVWVQPGMQPRGLVLVGPFGRLVMLVVMLVVTHFSSIAPGPVGHQGRRT